MVALAVGLGVGAFLYGVVLLKKGKRNMLVELVVVWVLLAGTLAAATIAMQALDLIV
jgi:hypothetical protein